LYFLSHNPFYINHHPSFTVIPLFTEANEIVTLRLLLFISADINFIFSPSGEILLYGVGVSVSNFPDSAFIYFRQVQVNSSSERVPDFTSVQEQNLKIQQT